VTAPTVIPDGLAVLVVRAVPDRYGHRTPMVHVQWVRSASAVSAAVQVYVDDELQCVVSDPDANHVWLCLDPFGSPRVDVVAVEIDAPHEAWTPLAPTADTPVDRVMATVERSGSLPIDARVRFTLDDRAIADGPMWDADAVRGGFGSLFGLGSFGIDAATAVGLGNGPLGLGAIDVDGDRLSLRYASPDLPVGQALLRAEFTADGRPVAEPVEAMAILDRLAPPPPALRLRNDNTLTWTRSS
jgi:hypothetical protein